MCYQNRNYLNNVIRGTKSKRPSKEGSGIYEIACQDCNQTYVGQTRIRMSQRNDEHERACINKQIRKSAVAMDCVEKNHKKCDIKLLSKVDNLVLLDAYENFTSYEGRN